MTCSAGWLISRGRHSEALDLVARLHANGKKDDELVLNSLHEMTTAIALEQQVSATWGSLVATKGNRRRMMVITIIATGTQWLGQGILSCESARAIRSDHSKRVLTRPAYTTKDYISPVLKTVGLTKTREITAFNLGLSVWNWGCASLGASLVDRVGRRALWVYGTFSFFAWYTMFMICSALYAERGNKLAANVSRSRRPFRSLARLVTMDADFCGRRTRRAPCSPCLPSSPPTTSHGTLSRTPVRPPSVEAPPLPVNRQFH